MATALSDIETRARRHLNEATASYWSSDELIDHINDGIKDLWKRIVDLHQEHFLTVDITNVSLAASTKTLTGVPADTFRIYNIERRDLTDSASEGLIFVPKEYNHLDFQWARSLDDQDPAGTVVFYAVHGTGAPTGAPTVRVAPTLNAAVNLALHYIPVQADVAAGGNNPIPGESDAALIAYCVAHARAKEREDRSPDPEWLAEYKTLKDNLLEVLTPRQEQDLETVEPMFGEYWF